MKNFQYNLNDKIVAIATPYANGALGIIRCSGQGCIETAAACFSSPEKLLQSPGNAVHYGHIQDYDSKEVLDEVLCTVFRAPATYTGEDCIEISCHGSLPGLESILRSLRAAGFRDAGPGEFTLRAFSHGKMDLSRAEAVNEIINAKTQKAHLLALNRLSGAVETLINKQKSKLLSLAASLAVQLDYPDDELDEDVIFDLVTLDEVLKCLQTLADTYQIGKLFQLGVHVALAGATNAGKSSLFNLFMKEDRSIVSDIHGTTRDYIEANLTLQGIPVQLFDTAGLRESVDTIEREGMRRSEQIMEKAALILYVIDGTSACSPLDQEIIQREKSNNKYIFIWNKIDAKHLPCPSGFFPVSAVNADGFHALEKEMLIRLTQGFSIAADLVIDSARQKDLLEKALEALAHVRNGVTQRIPLDAVSTDLHEALDALGELTGEVSSEDILTAMFSDFCVGK